jgi:flagellar motor switch protein FliM
MEHVSRAELLLEERLGWLMPEVSTSGEVPAEALSRLRQLFEEDVALRMDSVQAILPTHLKNHITPPTVLASLCPSPHKARGLLEVEASLAHAAVDLLLGGAGDVIALRPLTEIEEGVLSFLLVEALKALAPYVSPGVPRVRLEKMVRDVEEVLPSLMGERHLLAVQLRVSVGSHSGYLRLFLPESAVALATPPGGAPERRERIITRARHHASRLHGVTAALRVELGGFELTFDELSALEEKSVVLLPEPLTFRPDKGQGGPARIRTGAGRAGFLEANVQLHGRHYRATITNIVSGDIPQAQPDSSGPSPEGHAVEQPKPEGAVILKDIPQHVTVELGRVNLNGEEIVGLHVGQVLELNRTPNENVELSVNGTVVARGELVESEGQVGVRIVQIIR